MQLAELSNKNEQHEMKTNDKDLHANLAKLNRREKRQDCVNRLLAEISNVTTDVSIVDCIAFRQHQYGLLDFQMAKILGLSKTHYCGFINGRHEMPKKAMIRAMIIGVPLTAFAEYLTDKKTKL